MVSISDRINVEKESIEKTLADLKDVMQRREKSVVELKCLTQNSKQQ